MTLGENIRRLRTKRNLSQEDLAEQLEVSRQSVSKWETDASTPDLDKLVKLSRVFGVTLDELVCGAQPKPESPTYIPQLEKTRTPLRVVVGIVLLCMAFLTFWGGALLDGHLGSGLLLAAPFVLCGVICLLVPWHPGLVCAWTMSAVLDFFAVAGIRCGWRTVLRSLTRMGFSYFDAGWKFFDFAMMVLQLAWIVFLLVWTGRCLLPHIPLLTRKRWDLLCGGWLLFVLLHANWLVWVTPVLSLIDWLRFVLLAVLVACTAAGKRQNPRAS